jgi:hypothetical protein
MCQHRYTNISICAVPCDGVDDLCRDFEDENCQIPLAKFTLLFFLFLGIGSILVGEMIYTFENSHTSQAPTITDNYLLSFLLKMLSPDCSSTFPQKAFSEFHLEKTFSEEIATVVQKLNQLQDTESQTEVAKLLFKLEYFHHKENQKSTWLCLKNNLGTNDDSKTFFDLLKPQNGAIVKMSNLLAIFLQKLITKFYSISKCTKNNQCSKLVLLIKHQVIAFFYIAFYYLDLIKDCFLLTLLFQKVSLLGSFYSFEVQLLFLTSLSIFLPQIANATFVVYSTVTKNIHLASGIVLFFLVFLLPAVGIQLLARFKYNHESDTRKSSPEQNTKSYMAQVQKWSFRTSFLKMNEILFENTIQIYILMFLILMKFSSTQTIVSLETLFSNDETEYITLSAIWSWILIVLGEIKWQAALKNNCLGLKGSLILFLYFLLSLFTRTMAVLLYFAPSMGLINLLGHWKVGELKTSTEEIIYSLDANGNATLLKDIWVPITNYTELTNWDLATYFKAFLILTSFHFVIVFLITFFTSLNFRNRKAPFLKFFHILTQLHCPKIYQDWDNEISSLEEVQKNWHQVKNEMKTLLMLFSLEHILMCIPIWILNFNINKRNIYLDEFFPRVFEEQRATTVAYTLSIVCPIIFAVAPFLQYGVFILYNKNGHPWAKLLQSEKKEAGNENFQEMDDFSTKQD